MISLIDYLELFSDDCRDLVNVCIYLKNEIVFTGTPYEFLMGLDFDEELSQYKDNTINYVYPQYNTLYIYLN